MYICDMGVQQAYWKPGADLSMPLFIHRMDTQGRIMAPQIPAARIPMYGFMFLTTGQVLLDVGGSPVLLHGGEFLLIPEGMPFAVRYYQDSVGYTGGFRESFLKDASHPILREEGFSVHAFVHDDAIFMASVFSRMLDAFPADVNYLKSGLDFILAHLRPDEHQEGSRIAARFIDMVFDRERRIGTVASYAEEMEIGADLLNHHVRRYSNHSASEWITISRMALARNLLANTELPMSAVCDAVGLYDPSYFSRLFKKQEGVTPLEFRRKNSKKS